MCGFPGTHPLGWAESGRKITPPPGTHPLGWAKSGRKITPPPGTHPLGWAESGKNVATVGTKVPVPRCFRNADFSPG